MSLTKAYCLNSSTMLHLPQAAGSHLAIWPLPFLKPWDNPPPSQGIFILKRQYFRKGGFALSEQPDKETLLKWAQAQLDANRLQQDANNIERRRQSISLQVIEAAQHLAQEVRLFLHEIRLSREAQQKQAVWQDKVFEDIANRIERLERNQVLLLTENNPQKRGAASEELEGELAVRKELKRHYRNLHKLQEQAAEYGELDVPLKLANSIEAERERIAELEEKLS